MQFIGYVPMNELLELTPHEWEQMIKGARHRRIDSIEDMRLQSVMIARLNNGKDIKSINKDLQKERALINQSETSYELEKQKEKERKKHIRRVQRKAFSEWLEKRKKGE